ncbi:MAG: InlB B-repeat-containing protein, partial [Clostridia bacterium]|nr:InlB B-repeat-containing protein [Clostridia bacterium]
TSEWSEGMKIPHPEVKIRAAYSDGFDEITVSIYIPVESIVFVNSIVDNVENFRSYDMQAEAFPKYATLLADNPVPIFYSLNDIDASIAVVDSNGLLTLPKSLTSKGSIIEYSANLTNEWTGVDSMPLKRNLTVMPVYAEAFESIEIVKDGVAVDNENIKALPSDSLRVEIVYTIDNVTDIDVTLIANNGIITTSGSLIKISDLSAMNEDHPFITITVNYNHGGKVFSQDCYLSVYVPALSAEISDATFHRDGTLDLNSLITINGHGHASNKSVEWGDPNVTADENGIVAQCEDGFLYISTNANAGTLVRVPYRTFDSDTWQYKEFTVAALDGAFSLEYLQTNGKDGHKYDIDYGAPQLEEGQSVDMRIKYKGLGGKINYGLTYSVEVSSNATLIYAGGIKDYDTFTLSVKSGQSGRNNYVTYKITVHDGTQTYYIYTNGASAPSNIKSRIEAQDVAIFKRVSGSLGVSQTSIEIDNSFDLTGWDSSFTYNKEDLVWTLTGGSMNGSAIASAPDSGFTLTITAKQKYNGQEINFYSEVFFSAIVYYYENNSSQIIRVKSVYKKQGCSVKIAGELCTRSGYLQTGWSTANNGAKDYVFSEDYSGNQDKYLYAYWVRTSVVVHIGQDADINGVSGDEVKELDENQNKDFHTREYLVNLDINTLKELGYT